MIISQNTFIKEETVKLNNNNKKKIKLTSKIIMVSEIPA